jgi:hypothetical protein
VQRPAAAAGHHSLTREEGEVPGKVKPAGTQRGGGVLVEGGSGALGGGVLRQGAVARDAAGGASERKKDGGARTENRATVPL